MGRARFALHGLAHLVATSDSFSKAADATPVDYLADSGRCSDPTVLRLYGLIWALFAVAFLVTAVVTRAGSPAWPRVLGWNALASLALSFIALWASIVGVVNLALVGLAWRASGQHRRTGRAARARSSRRWRRLLLVESRAFAALLRCAKRTSRHHDV